MGNIGQQMKSRKIAKKLEDLHAIIDDLLLSPFAAPLAEHGIGWNEALQEIRQWLPPRPVVGSQVKIVMGYCLGHTATVIERFEPKTELNPDNFPKLNIEIPASTCGEFPPSKFRIVVPADYCEVTG